MHQLLSTRRQHRCLTVTIVRYRASCMVMAVYCTVMMLWSVFDIVILPRSQEPIRLYFFLSSVQSREGKICPHLSKTSLLKLNHKTYSTPT